MSIPVAPSNSDRIPIDFFPKIKDAKDPKTATEAYQSVRALFDHRVAVYGDKPFIGEVMNIDEAEAHGKMYSFREVSSLVDKAMVWLNDWIPRRTRTSKPVVVGTLGRNGLAYVVWDMALTKMGHIPLCMSTTLAPSAAAALMRNVGASYVLYMPELASLASEAASLAATQPITWLTAEELENLPTPAAMEDYTSQLATSEEWDEPFVLIHSSGSTGAPKAFTFKHSATINNAFLGPDEDSLALVPMSHGYIRIAWLWTLIYARTIWFHPPTAPLTPSNVLRSLDVSKAQRLYAVPIALNYLVPFADRLTHLSAVVSAGSPLSQVTGDALVAKGVPVVTLYGQNEHTVSMSSERDYANDKEWNYMKPLSTFLAKYYKFEEVDEGKYEMIIDAKYPILSRTTRENGDCETGDCFAPHPTRENTWRYVARKDDLIVHSTGHKTDPLPMEQFLTSSPLIKEVLVVGTNRPQAALLVVPVGNKEEIHKLIQDANANAPSHSRIIPELVVFLDPKEEFIHTAKQSIVRGATLKNYESVINGLYDGYEVGVAGTGEVGTLEEVKEKLRSILEKLFPPALAHSSSEDFFALGMNSLIATQIRNAVQRNFQTSASQDIVFLHPSIDSLAAFIVSGGGKAGVTPDEMLQAAVSKLERPTSYANGHTHEETIVLLTGATGTIGSHILHQLFLASTSPIKVICPVRASTEAKAGARLSESLASRKLPPLTSLQSEFNVEASLADALPPKADIVIHCAWPVNFNYTVSSFQPSIDSTVSLLNAYPSARHMFLSSISVGFGSSNPVIPETMLAEAPPGEFGYAKSKWVAEHLFSSAGTKGWKTSIIRIGQITGDSINGIWNEVEAPPLLIQASQILGVAPSRGPLGEEVRWLSVDQTAWAIATLSLDDISGGVYNLLADTATTHEEVLKVMSQSLGTTWKTITYELWVERLAAAGKDIPAKKLMSFWEAHTAEAPEAKFEMAGLKKALARARREQGQGAEGDVEKRLFGVDKELLGKIVRQWKTTGFLE